MPTVTRKWTHGEKQNFAEKKTVKRKWTHGEKQKRYNKRIIAAEL